MVEAKDLGTFIIEPVGSDIMNPDTYLVRKRFQDTETTTSYANNAFSQALQDISDSMCSSSTSVGCRIGLKNGLYEIDQGPDTGGGLVEWSTQAEGHHVSVQIEGETREGCIIRNIETTPEETPTSRVFLVRCNFDIRNLTMDGGGQLGITGTLNGINCFGQTNGKVEVHLDNVHMKNFEGNHVNTAQLHNMIVENSIFEAGVGDHGMVDAGSDDYTIIKNNRFDKTTGEDNGSCITSAGGDNIFIEGNHILKGDDTMFLGFGISLEGNFSSFNKCVISNNFLENARIFVGASGSWTNSMTNIFVTNNHIWKGGLYCIGPSTPAEFVQNIYIENNQLIDSWRGGINCQNVGKFVSIRNNTVQNSNSDATAQTGQEACIFVKSCTDAIIQGNFVYMGKLDPDDDDFSTHGIRYSDLVNPTIVDNHVINRTTNNPSYESTGTHTGTVLISRNL